MPVHPQALLAFMGGYFVSLSFFPTRHIDGSFLTTSCRAMHTLSRPRLNSCSPTLLAALVSDGILMRYQLQEQLQQSGLQLLFDSSVTDYLVKEGHHPQWGARPLKRLMQRMVLNELSLLFLPLRWSPQTVLGDLCRRFLGQWGTVSDGDYAL